MLLIELDGSFAGVGPNGLRLNGGGSTVSGLIINRFRGSNFTQGNGIVLQSNNNTVAGCFIGTDAGATVDLGNTGSGIFFNGANLNTVGGVAPASRNVISNNEKGLDLLNSANNSVIGNYIGTGRDGQSPLGNNVDGVLLNSSSNNNVGAGNVINGNGRSGVFVNGNASNNFIFDNVISSNNGAGVAVTAAARLATASRVTPSSGTRGSASTSARTASPPTTLLDFDGGANNQQNFPTLTSVTTDGDAAIVKGTFNSTPGGTFTIGLFANDTCDPSGNGEGQQPLVILAVRPGADGNASFTSPPLPGIAAGQFVTATATDVSLFDHDGNAGTPTVFRNDTSEFSPCAAVLDVSQDITRTVENTNDNGPGSLRAAVTSVNAGGGGVINFAPAVSGTITLLSGELEINAARSVTILGPGSDRLNVSGNKTSRVFNVKSGSVKINGLAMTDGLADTGGGLRNSAALTLEDCKVVSNSALSPGGGGGIHNVGSLTLNACEVSSNNASQGGGVLNEGTLNVNDTNVSRNLARRGGGVLNVNSGTVNIEFSNVSTNTADSGEGGGILNLNASSQTSLTVKGSTVADNLATTQGAGIHNAGKAEVSNSSINGNRVSPTGGIANGGGVFNGGSLSLVNSTVSGNVASPGTGGGVFNGGTATVISSTVTKNNALRNSGPGEGFGGGIFNSPPGVLSARSSIIAGNDAPAGPDFQGTLASDDFNLVGDTAGANITGSTANNKTNVNARLGPLANNGGPTNTHALLEGSPAFDSGDNRVTAPPFNLLNDQRGKPRPGRASASASDNVDIGAYETGFIITGDVSNPAIGKPGAGVRMSLLVNDSVLRTTETDANGQFVFMDVPEGGDYVLLPQFLGGVFDTGSQQFFVLSFSPPTLDVPQVGGDAGDVTGLHFDWGFGGEAVIAKIAVRLNVAGGGPNDFVRDATVTLSGPKSEVTNVPRASGEYLFEQIPRGGDYVVTPTHPGFTFKAVSCGPANASANDGGGCVLNNLLEEVTMTFEAEAVKPPPPALDDDFKDAFVIKEHFNFGVLSLDPCDTSGAVSVAQGDGRLTITPPEKAPPAEPCLPSAQPSKAARRPAADAPSGAFNGYVAVRDFDLNSITNVSVEAVKTLQGPGAHTIFSVGRDNTNFFSIRVGEDMLASGPARSAVAAARAGKALTRASSGPTIFFESNDPKFSHSESFKEKEDVFWRLRFEPVRAAADLPSVCRERGVSPDARRVVLYETSADRVRWAARHCAPIDRTRTQVASELLAGVVGNRNTNPGAATFKDYKVAEQTRIGFRLESLSPVINPNLKVQDIKLEVERRGANDSSAFVRYEFDETSELKKGVHFEDITEGAGVITFAPGASRAKDPIVLRLRVDDLGANVQKLKLRLKDDPKDTEDDVAGAVIDDERDEAALEVGAGNPIDRARFFVERHYLDFLGRPHDERGRDFWAGGIETCGDDQSCVNTARVNVSAAFFFSIEFQETGFSVYRANKAAYGNLPGKPVPVTLCQLRAETEEIKGDVQVGVGDWARRLEDNKAAYFRRFVATPRFKERYDPLKSFEYVETLYANAGLSPSVEDSTALVVGLLTQTETRATVLRKISERSDYKLKENNRAFVAMQYFGYLRRDPDPPGFAFWLKKLEDNHGDFRAAQMVFAFIDSIEYRDRFVKPQSDPCDGP